MERCTREEFRNEVRMLSTNHGYINRYIELCSSASSFEHAWRMLEAERNDIGLDNKYTTYDSFRARKKNLIIRFV